jgi:hypothetical protein
MSIARRILLGAAIVWTILILIGTLLPANSLPDSEGEPGFSLLDLPYFDKAVHFTLFLGFGILWMLVGRTPAARLWVVGAGIGLAILTEFLQLIPAIGREAGWEDVAADSLGLALAFILAPRFAEVLARVPWMRQPEHPAVASAR